MIKELINDLVYDKISLNQGLTRAKIIAYQINDDTFKDWISHEINGYNDLEKLPSYRIVSCELYGILNVPFHGTREVPILTRELNKMLGIKMNMNEMNVAQSISTLEETVTKPHGAWGYDQLPTSLVKSLSEMTNSPEMVQAYRKIQISQISHILNLTKQKLIDTLLELDKVFPNLSNEFKDTIENSEKVQNIITNNIYGNHVNSSIGIGDNIEQTQNITSHEEIVENRLKEIEALGVDKDSIADLRQIANSKEDKSSISKKVLTWLGCLTQKTIEKGIDISLPLVMDKLKDLM